MGDAALGTRNEDGGAIDRERMATLGVLAAARPSVTIAPAVAKIGQSVRVSADGFPAGHAVAVTLCGNAGRRGSVDCEAGLLQLFDDGVAQRFFVFDDQHAHGISA